MSFPHHGRPRSHLIDTAAIALRYPLDLRAGTAQLGPEESS